MLITGGSGSGKTNALLNLTKEKDSDNLIVMIYLYAKDLNDPKHQFLIKKRKDVGIKHLNNPFVIHLWNIHNIWMMFTIMLMVTIQTEEETFLLCLMI